MYRSTHWAALGLSLGLAWGQAQAVPLSTLLLSGGSISAGDFTLTGWVLPASMMPPPDLSKIEVSAATSLDRTTLDVTFEAGNALTLAGVATFSFIDLALAYTISTADRLAMTGAMLGLSSYSLLPSDSDLSGVFINQYLYRQSVDSKPQFPDINALAALKVQVDPGFSGTQTAATAAISGGGQSPYVYTNTLVVADVGETAGITRFTQRFIREVFAVPEPASWLLVAVGGVLFGWRRLRSG